MDSRTLPHAKATVHYLSRDPLYDVEKPYRCLFPVDDIPGASSSNLKFIPCEVSIVAITNRELANNFTLNEHGFEFVKLETGLSLQTLKHSNIARRAYCAEIESYLKHRNKASHAFTFDNQVRIRDGNFPDEKIFGSEQPVQGVHVDYSAAEAQAFMKRILAENARVGKISAVEADELSTKPFELLNVWRPLFGPLEDWPLAVCDYRSIDEAQDTITVDDVYPHRVGEHINFFFNPSHKWYFLERQAADEAIIIRIYNSRSSGARYGAHAAFDLQDRSPGRKPRESIEARTLLIYGDIQADDQGNESS